VEGEKILGRRALLEKGNDLFKYGREETKKK